MGFNCSLYREYGDNLMLSALILHSLRRRRGKNGWWAWTNPSGAKELVVELLLLEQSPEANSEVAGVRVDQDAEAQGDTSQATGPRLRKYFIKLKKISGVAPQASRQASVRTPNQNSYLKFEFRTFIWHESSIWKWIRNRTIPLLQLIMDQMIILSKANSPVL